MKSLGFQGCCLRCDAEDVGGLERCNVCISNHTNVRNKMVSASPDDKLFQHVKELYSMISEPHKHDYDPVHRNQLILQQELAGVLDNSTQSNQVKEVEEIFSNQREQKNKRQLQDLGNKNHWRNNTPTPELARMIGKETWESKEEKNLSDYGARTIPSKIIETVDRSDRVGEDIELTDVVQAKISGKENVDLVLKEKKSERKKWVDVIGDISDILDDV